MTSPPLDHSGLLAIEPNPQSRCRLWCFPYAGGGASIFFDWERGLAPGIQVCPVQLPGRENRLREVPHRALGPVVGRLADLVSASADVPFALFGHSLGALIGFELARELRRRGLPGPVHLFAAGHRAPQLKDRAQPIHRLPDAAFLTELEGRFGDIPQMVRQSQELLTLLLPTLKADMEMVENYSYAEERSLDCPITAFGGRQDPEVSREELAAWGQQTRRRFTLEMLPGTHWFIRSTRTRLLRLISRDLLLHMNRRGQRADDDRP